MEEESRQVTLVISEIEARNLGIGASGEHKYKEQYVTVSLKGKKIKTKHPGSPDSGSDQEDGSKWGTRWKESLEITLGDEKLQRGECVKIKITQPAFLKDKLLGNGKLPVEELISKKGATIPFTIGLQDGNDHPIEAIFKCTMKYLCPGSVPENQTSATIEGKDSVDAGLAGQHLPTTRTHVPNEFQKIPFPEKPRDFQIRIKVIEGRHISGRDVNPVVRVTVGKIKKQTGVKPTTNQPYYNQTFPFNFYATKFQDLFEEQIRFEVFDSRRLRHDSLIGFYKCDVRELYNFQGHMVLRKWIVLAEPRQSEKIIQGENVITKAHGFGGNACGFLKVSMVVLEAHMDAPSLENIVGSGEEDNIESNLLHLPGVSLSPAVFSLKIYRAEDIPQMDHEDLFNRFRKKRKESADPYCIFSFAGKQATTSTKFESRTPQFNEKLNLSFKYPSVCDNLKIQLMDKDFGTLDDYIGTIYLPVSQLSGQGGNESLPTFGPCFVNMYGSPREYSDWPNKYEDLDKGIGEGAAYRGRVFLELETKLDEKKEHNIEQVKNVDIVRVQPYMRRKRFRLLAVFLEATMLAIEDSQVEFEISIGNYGNKLDDSVSPRPSSTPPTNPVFDGEKYFYLPWGNSKPYVSINCEWEDISFRLGALNKLLKISRNLERNVNTIKSTKGEKYKERVSNALDSLIVDCSSLPNLDPKTFKLTKLDLQMNEVRKDVLKSIAEECKKLKKKLDDPVTLQNLEIFLKRIQMIAIEPQNSIPDVIIWMIKAERERIAYCRIPAYELLYCEDETQRGLNCGKTIDVNLKFPGKEDSSHKSKYAAMLRLMVWLGRQKHQSKWEELKNTGGNLSLYAETYENQTFYGKWTSVNLNRPAFSNASGTLELPKDKFEAPDGWKFVGDWEVHSEISARFSKDSGCNVFLEDVFENEYRLIPGGQWEETKDQILTDRFGNPILDNDGKPINSKDKIRPPNGWHWSQEKWIVDKDRAVDSDGWEYTLEPSYGSTDYHAAEKTFHFCRRRRWVKERCIKDVHSDVVPVSPADKDGWEYAFTFKSKFHTQSKPLYIVRRRRLRKQLVQERHTTTEPVFIVKNKDKEMGKNAVLVPPSIFLLFNKDPIICQLRAYLFQGRNLLPSDPDGLADPFVRLSFGTRSATSRTINKKLNPTWDQMLVLERVPIYGHPDQVFENPPDVVLELFDWDPVGKKEFLGRVQVEPHVLAAKEESKTKLSWIGVYKGSSNCGDILAAFDLFLNEGTPLPKPDPKPKGWFPIPEDIRPKTRRTAVEVLCWGLRNLRSYHWRKVNTPSIEIEIGDKVKKKYLPGNVKGNSNFEGQRVLCFDVNLPCEAIYLPAITIQLKTSSSQSPIGICVVENLHEFRRKKNERRFLINEDEMGSSSDDFEAEAISIVVDNGAVKKASKKPKMCDWWSKYYATKQATAKEEKQLKIYPHSLEKEFENFQDNIKTFYFRRGKKESFDKEDEDSIVGEFKGALAIYHLQDGSKEVLQPKVFVEQNQMCSVPCLIRVYVVKAIDLKPKDKDGLSDPYLVVSLGDKTFDTQDEYEADTLEVEFGKVFEFRAVIPDVKDLTVKVVDYDFGNDDLIGETQVDLENRLLSRRHATVGLPSTYEISGPKKWRLGKDYIPSKILELCCKDFDFKYCFEDNDSVLWIQCGERKHYFSLAHFEDSKTDLTHAGETKERLSLYVLNSFMDEHSMVPEHIETRDLTNKLFPGFSQGKLEMFIDIFPEKYGIPGPVIDIAPRKPKKYELRVIVWNTKDVKLQETNIYGDEMSDIFVKCRLTGVDDIQKTDTHFRSLNGDGMFNYRMVFPFEYSETKGKIIIMKKAHFLSRRKYSDEQLPQLDVQVWDNDLFSSNDFIGDVKLHLQELSKPSGKSKDIKDWKLSGDTNSLFEKGIVRGWWPVAGKPKKKKASDSQSEGKSNELVLTGKVELTLELLEENDAKSRPVGKGQSKPNQHPVLDKPKRPATSFLWILNPWKSFRYVIWSHFKWYFIGAIVLILIVLFFALFLYAAPGYSVKKLFKV